MSTMTIQYQPRPAVQVRKHTLVQYGGKTWQVTGRANNGELVELRRDGRTQVVRGHTRVGVPVEK